MASTATVWTKIEPKELRQLRALAEAEGRTIAGQARIILRRHLTELREKETADA